MRKFLTELQGKQVTTTDGVILGTIDNLVVDTDNGSVVHLLVTAAEQIDARRFQRDGKGRLFLPFKTMRAVQEVVVVDLAQ